MLLSQIDYDNDSGIGGMTPVPSTLTMQSDIYEFVEENGRTYHRYKEGSKLSNCSCSLLCSLWILGYMLPNDEVSSISHETKHL